MIAIDAKIFSEIVRKLPDSDIVIETDEKDQMTITCEKAKFDIMEDPEMISPISLSSKRQRQ